ncbi:MAG: VWA domain-containing protein [Desulfovibrio sp.]|jgi:serine/threonine-protein kinase PpkA|nr:VWA domain-containing protein [Desulfovibrio sp.]
MSQHKNLPVFVQSAAVCLLLCLCAGSVSAAGRSPLLLEGKKTLYQRVVTHPGARLTAGPEEHARVLQDPVKTFSVFYVFERRDGFLEVGPSTSAPAGWMRENEAVDWPQAMTLLFAERSGRMPVLFFKNLQALEALCAADDLKERLQNLEKASAAARAGQEMPADTPLLASEPPDVEGAVSASRFYLMPIRSMSAPFEGTKFLEVTSIDPGSGVGEKTGQGTTTDGAGDGRAGAALPSTGIAFVIDTTISMKPYIDASLQVVRAAFDDIEKQKLDAEVGFAVMAFRSSTQGRPEVEYTTRKVCDFTTLKDRKKLEGALAEVREAAVSTHDYDEDSMAGVKAAVDELNWSGYNAAIIVLITDAGPLRPGDPLAGTRMAPPELRDYARAKHIWLTACHILTPTGKNDHAYAAKAYRDLTRTSDKASSYMPIKAPDQKTGAESFRRTATQLAASLAGIVKYAAADAKKRRLAARPNKDPDPEEEARRIGESIGYAARLDFLGKQRGNRAPSVVNAWIADMDLSQLADGRHLATVETAVLLTKNQLSDLQRTLQVIVDNAERTKKTDSRDFFQSILSASVRTARDPAAFSAQPGRNLQESGILGEFLEGLPYKSDIMLLREEDWYRMSVGEQTAFVNRLKSRISRYEEYDKDAAVWESFGAENSGDWVCRIPLSILP